MKKHVDDMFLEWQIELPEKDQGGYTYHGYDAKLQILFVRRHEGFDVLRLASLEHLLKEYHPDLLVSSVTVESYEPK